MGFAVFLMAAAITIFLEATFWRRLTPNLVAAIPTTILVTVATLVTPYFGFVNPSTELYLLLSLFFLTGSLSSLLMGCIFRGRNSFRTITTSFSIHGQNLHWLKFLLLVACFIALYKAAQAYLLIGNLHDEEFSNLLSHGVAGHALVFCMVAAPVLFFSRKKGDRLALFIIAISFLLLFLKQVKGWLIIPILFAILLQWHSGRLQIRGFGGIWLAFLPLLMTAIFFAAYLLGWSSRSGFALSWDDAYSAAESISIHFLGYLVSGVLGFSEILRTSTALGGEKPEYLIATLYNILAFIQGNPPISPISEIFISTNALRDKASNVYTIWGTLFLRSGITSFFIYFLLIAGLSALLGIAHRNRFIFLLYCYLASFLALGWFDYYYFHLSVYEGALFLLIISFIQRTYQKRTFIENDIKTIWSAKRE